MRNILMYGLLLVAASPALALAQPSTCEQHYEQGELDAAVAACTAALTADPEDVQAWTLRGMAHHAAERLPQAQTDLDRALGIDPRHLPALEARAYVHAANDDMKSALADMSAALQVAPRDSRLLLLMGDAQDAAKNEAAARDYYERAAKADKNNADAWLRLADLAGTEKPKERLGYLDKAVKADARTGTALYWRASHYADRSEYKKAIADLRTGLKRAPDDIDLLKGLATMLVTDKAPREALKVLDSALAFHPPDVEFLLLRTRAQLDNGNVLAAMHAHQWVRELDAGMARNLEQEVKTAFTDKYASSKEKASQALAGLKTPALDCKVMTNVGSLVDALGDTGGARAQARQRIATRFQDFYSHCLDRAQPPGTEKFAEARQWVGEARTHAATVGAQLNNDCTPYADRLDCNALAAGIGSDSEAQMNQLRSLEQKAAEQRQAIVALRNTADRAVADAVLLVDRELLKSSARRFDDYLPGAERRAALSYVQQLNWRDVSSACPAPPTGNSGGDIDADRFNRQSREYQRCLDAYTEELRGQRDLVKQIGRLEEQRKWLAALQDYRCSRQSGEGCVPDANWNRIEAELSDKAVDRALQVQARRHALLDGDIRSLIVERNQYIDSINQRNQQQQAQYEREERARAIQQGLQDIADSLEQQNQRYRRDSSVSLPGIR